MNKLEIGGGSNPTKGYLNLDINPKCNPDIVGDVRAFFSPDLDIEDFPQLVDIKEETFDEIKATHFIEHVEWIYQKPMFDWFYRMLRPRGRVILETPNLEWIARSYLRNYGSGMYPPEDHPDLSGTNDFVPWVNFKLFSGCSPGDYHHSMFDKVWMKRVLEETGFTPMVKAKGSYIQATGIKNTDVVLPEEEEYYNSKGKRGWLDSLRWGGWINRF